METLTENMTAYLAGEEPCEELQDFVTARARSDFGIKYLFPWQRLVIANILDAVAGLTEESAVDV